MSDGSASCAQDWSLALRPWSCPSSPCQMTSVLAHFARQLSDATAAGRLAQTSRAGDRLMRNRLPKLREERQAAAQAAAQAKAAKRRAWYDCFEASEDGVHYRCIAGNIAWGTPCVWHHTAYSRCRQSQQTFESPTVLPPKRIRSIDHCF